MSRYKVTKNVYGDDDDDIVSSICSPRDPVSHDVSSVWTESTGDATISDTSGPFDSSRHLHSPSSSAAFKHPKPETEQSISLLSSAPITQVQQDGPIGLSSTAFSVSESNLINTKKLQIRNLGLHGREKETKLLIDRLNNLEQRHQLILISGESGTGKTTLARFACGGGVVGSHERQNRGNPCVCFDGKFDQSNTTNLPYGAFAVAFQKLVGHVLQLKEKNEAQCKKLQKDLIEKLEPREWRALVQTFPELEELVSRTDSLGLSDSSQKDSTASGKEREAQDASTNSTPVSNDLNHSHQQQQRPQHHSDNPKYGAPVSTAAATAKSRFHHAFRIFLRIISDHLCGLVLIIDDLQWADPSSLDLLNIILTDSICEKRVAVIGCYRSDEVDQNHSFSKILRDWKSHHQQQQQQEQQAPREKSCSRGTSELRFDVTEICIGNLGLEETELVLSDVLSTDPANITDLAQVCHTKTNGNAFFLIQFVTDLYRRKLLQFSSSLMAWRWDLSQIKLGTNATENVANFVMTRLTVLDEDLLLVVKVAGCLGERFDRNLLKYLFELFCGKKTNNGNDQAEVDTRSDTGMPFEAVLQLLVSESILQEDLGSYIRFVHDKIQEAAVGIMGEQERSILQKRIAEALRSKLSDDELESNIFIVTSLYNSSGTDSMSLDERIMLAELNLQAAEHASKMSANEIAAGYAGVGIGLLDSADNGGDWKWNEHPVLIRSLYATACRSELCIGNHDRVESLSAEMFGRKEIPLVEKLPVYASKLGVLETQGDRCQESINLSLSILEELGQKLPRSKLGQVGAVLVNLVKIRRLTKKITPYRIAQLPIMDRIEIVWAMKILDKLCAVCIIHAHLLFLSLVVRMVELTLEYGICEASPAAFAQLGVMMMGLNKPNVGAVLAERGVAMLDMLPSDVAQAAEARVKFLARCYVQPWSVGSQNMITPLLEVNEIGLKNGDVQSAIYAIGAYVILAFICGRPLDGLEQECEVYFGKMKELGMDRMYVASNFLWQAILNLRGNFTESHLVLNGPAMNEEQYLSAASSEPPECNDGNNLTLYFIRSMLYAIFGAYQKGADNAIEHSAWMFTTFGCYPPMPCISYYMGLSLVDTFSHTKKRIYKRYANVMHSKLKSYVCHGTPDIWHYKYALEAELLALNDRKFFKAKQAFEKAISFATNRNDFVHDAALIHERCGRLYLKKHHYEEEKLRPRHDPNQERTEAGHSDGGTYSEKGMYHLDKALQMYVKWGAQQKVDFLLAEFRDKWPSPTSVVTGGD